MKGLHFAPETPGLRGRGGPWGVGEAEIEVRADSGTLVVRVKHVRVAGIKLPAGAWQGKVRQQIAPLILTAPAWLKCGVLPDGAWFGVEGLSVQSVLIGPERLVVSF